MHDQTSKVRADFDRIALLSNDKWDHNSHYHRYLLSHLSPHCQEALDIGCGTGVLARQLAARSQHVLAVDLSPEMIRVARERSKAFANVEFCVADVRGLEWPEAQYDCIASIATLHHLPFEEMLCRMKRALKPEGVLVVLDLFRSQGPVDLMLNGVAWPVSLTLRLLKTRRLRDPAALRAAWADHGCIDSYLTMAQVRDACARLLPGAQVRRHLLWRYSIVWKADA